MVDEACGKGMPAMTDKERGLLLALFGAFCELRNCGWRESMYAPFDKDLELIEAGSTGIHKGYRDKYSGFWIVDPMDTWPANPILYRLPSN